jgi:hypothetical protein
MWKNKIKKAKQAEPEMMEGMMGMGGGNDSGSSHSHLEENQTHHRSEEQQDRSLQDEDDEDIGEEGDEEDLDLLSGKRIRNQSETNERRDSNEQALKRGRTHEGGGYNNISVEPISVEPSPSIHYQYESRNSKASKRDQNWDLQFESLLAYANKHKHCNVRTGYTTNDDDKPHVNLYAWLALQRRHKKQNKLRPDREKKLQSLVDANLLSWSGSEAIPRPEDEEEYIHVLPPPPPPSWESHFHELLIYAELHGHANVPLGYLVTVDKRKDIDLGAWLEEQRKQNSRKLPESVTNAPKLNILADEGRFSWQTPRASQIIPAHILDLKWSYRYEAMRSYISQDGNHLVCLGDNIKANLVVPIPDPTSVTPNGGSVEVFDLGLWILAQRKCFAAGVLDDRRKCLLQMLVDANQFTWQSKEEAARLTAEDAKRSKEEEALWNAWYNALVWQGNHVGHCNLDSHGTITLPDGSEAELGKWLHIQRAHIKKGRLRLDRAKKIKKLFDEGKLQPERWGAVFGLNYPPGSFEEPSLPQPPSAGITA